MTPPNFKGKIPRLATDRYDFQNHIDGYSFNHNSAGIVVSPAVVIDGTSYTNLDAAIRAQASLTAMPVSLSGDVDGYSNANIVSKIHGASVPTIGATGNVLQVLNGVG